MESLGSLAVAGLGLGFFGSLHCVGMCGGILAALGQAMPGAGGPGPDLGGGPGGGRPPGPPIGGLGCPDPHARFFPFFRLYSLTL